MGDKAIESKLTFGICDAETGEYKELGSTDAIPQFATGGIIPPDDLFGGVDLAGETDETVITMVFKSKKYAKRLMRNFRRAITGYNNRRKMRGLPMYRQYRR